MFRIIGAGLMIVAAGLAAAGFFLYPSTEAGSAHPHVEDDDVANAGSGQLVVTRVNDLGQVKLQSMPIARFEFRNLSGHTIRIVGAADGCRAGLCVFMRTELPLDIPASHAVILEFDCHLRTPGAFNERVAVYTNERSQPVIKLTISGQVVE